jgi:uncharacterized protein YeaO (DUF488 family)
MSTLQIKRIYQPAEKIDGKRILVDRPWPRGLKKEAAQIDEWMKAIAPSDALRKWFHQDNDAGKWPEFKTKCLLELKRLGKADKTFDQAHLSCINFHFSLINIKPSSTVNFGKRLLFA